MAAATVDTVPGATRRVRPSLTIRVVTVVILVVLCAVLATALVILLGRRSDHQKIDSSRNESLLAANAAIPTILSYNYKTLAADIAKAKSLTTGQFAKDYATLSSQVIATSAPAAQIVTTATSAGASVVSAGAKQTDVLVFIDQKTTGKNLTATKVNTSAVEATMSKVGGHWLVSNLTVVPEAAGS